MTPMNPLPLPDLTPDQIEKIAGFLGYGNPSARVWFIGIEEGIGGMTPDDVAHNLKARTGFQEVMDMRLAHLRLREGGTPIDIEVNTPKTQVWQYMAKIMLPSDPTCDWKSEETKEAYRRYVKTKLGRSDGDTFLTELNPFPQKSAAGKALLKKFKAIHPDLDFICKRRHARLQGMLSNRRSETVVLCYGTGRAKQFAALLGIEWRPCVRKIQTSECGRCFLLPFLGFGQISHADISDIANEIQVLLAS